MPRYSSDLERFQSKHRVLDNGCWEWTAARNDSGYGMFWLPLDGPTQTVRAHRWSYEQRHGRIAADLQLDHLCRNRSCVNPEHLEPVAPAVNTQRGVMAALTPDIVRSIRERRAAGERGVDIAREIGISEQHVCKITRRRAWKNVA